MKILSVLIIATIFCIMSDCITGSSPVIKIPKIVTENIAMLIIARTKMFIIHLNSKSETHKAFYLLGNPSEDYENYKLVHYSNNKKIQKQFQYHDYMSVSEKTLELNVTHNIITLCRFLFPNAFLNGYTLNNERIHGLDVSINIQNGRLGLSYQFKKPTRRLNIFKFLINKNTRNDQHIRLFLWSIIFRMIQGYSPIFYAFPTIADYNTVNRISPNFIDSTYFVSPLDFPIQILDNVLHYVEIDNRTNNITVHSNSSFKISKFAKGIQILDQIVQSYNKSEEIKTIKNKIKEISKKQIFSYIQEKYDVSLDPITTILEKNWKLKLKGLIYL